MKTIRTIIATLAGVLLSYAVVAWASVRREAAYLQRTIYQGFDQTFVVALVMGCALLLIGVILTVAIVSTGDGGAESEEEEEPLFPSRKQAQPKPPVGREQTAYHRPIRPATMGGPAEPEVKPEEAMPIAVASRPTPPKPQMKPAPKKEEAYEEPSTPEKAEAPEIAPAPKEPRSRDTFYCIYCGGPVTKGASVCPHCHKQI